MISLGSLLLELQLDTDTFYRDLEKVRSQALNAAKRIEADFKHQSKIRLKVSVDDKALTNLNRHLDTKRSHLNEIQRHFNSHPLKVKVDDSELTKLNQKLTKVKFVNSQIQVSYKERLVSTKKQNKDVANSASHSNRNVENNIDKIIDKVAKAIEKGFKDVRKKDNAVSSTINNVVSGAVIGGIAGTVIGLIQSGLKNAVKQQIGQVLKNSLSGVDSIAQAIPKTQNIAKKYAQAFVATPLPTKKTENAQNRTASTINQPQENKATAKNVSLQQMMMTHLNKRDILEPIASSLGIKGARKSSKQDLVQELIKQVPEDILRQKLPFMVEPGQQVLESIKKRSTLDPTALKQITQPILKNISTRSRSSLRGSQLADLSNDIEREYQIVLGMLSENLPKDAKNILQGAKMTLGKARAEAIRNAIAEVKERTQQQSRPSAQSQGVTGLARMSGGKDPLQPMKNLRRDALRQMRQNYQDVFAELAKANNYALDLKRLPKLVVDDAALRNMGADAFYDIKNNQILISKEIHKTLQKTPEELAEAEEILKTLAHEARHVFQSDYGRIPLDQLIKGASSVPLVDPSKASAEAVRSARRNIRQIRRDNPKMPWTQLKGVEALEIDAYQSEGAAKQVANRLRQNSSQRQTTKQALQQTLDNLLEVLRNFTKEVDAIAPIIRTSFTQLKDSLQDGAAQLYENAKEWLHFAINPKPKTVLSNQGLARMQGNPTIEEVRAFIKDAQRYAKVLERSARTKPVGGEEASGTRFVNRLIPRNIRRAVNQGQSQGVDAFNFVSQNIPGFFKNPIVDKVLTYKLKFDIKGMSDVIDQLYKDLSGFFKFAETKAGQSPYLGEFLQKLTGGFKNVNLAAVGATAVFFRFFSMMKYIGYLQQLSAATIATASAFEALNRQFILASKTEAQGAKSLQNVFNTTRELRLSRPEAIEGAAQIQAGLRSRILDQRQIDQFQRSVAQTARVYGKNPQEYQQIYGGFAQLTQNPTINQQDIAQLQNSVPDAFAIMARAAGTTEAEFQRMLNTGTLITSEFLPALTNQLQVETAPKVGKAVDTMFAANQRLENSFQDLQLSFSNFVLPLEKMRINLYADAIEKATGLSTLFGNALNGLAAFGVYKFAMAVVRLADKILVIARAIPALNLAILAMARIAQQVAANILPIVLKMGKELLIFQVAVDTFTIIGTAFQNAGGKIKEFAEQSAKNLQEYRKALLEAKGASLDFVKSLPATTDQIKGGGTYLEKTFLGGLLPKDWQRNIENYYLKDPLGAQSGLGMILRATGAKPYAEKVTGDMGAEAQKAIATSQERIGEINSQFNPGSILQQLRQFDKELDRVQNRRRAIAIVDPANRREMELLKREEERIIKQREGLSKPVESLSAGIAADVKGFQESLAEYDRLAQDGAITGEEYRERTTELRDALEKAQSAQDQLNKVVKSSLTPLQAFERAWARIATSLEDTKTALERNLNLSKSAIAQREANGSITQGQADFEGAIEQQKALQQQMQANVQTIRQMYAELNNQNAAEIFNNLGVDSNSGAAQIRAIAEQAEGYPREKALLEKFAQTKDIEQQTYQLQAQVGEARTSMIRQLRDMTKNVADYYRSVSRQSEEIAIETAKLRSQLKISSQQNKLRNALLGVQENIVTQFIEGIIESMGQVNQASEAALDAQSKMLQNRNQFEDSVRQGIELSRSIPGELPKIPVELDLSRIRDDTNIATVQSEIESSVSATKDLERAIASSTQELNSTTRSADELYKNLVQGVLPIEESEKALQQVGQGLERANNLTSQSSQLSNQWSQSLGGVQQNLTGISGFFTNILQYIQQAIASTGQWLSGLTNSLSQVGNTIGNTLSGLNEQKDNQLAQFAGGVETAVAAGLGFNLSPNTSEAGSKVAEQALSWAGKDFKKGVFARCADFVRTVLGSSGFDMKEIGITNRPVDAGTQPNNGALMARSFFGSDIGTVFKDPNQAKPGDIIGFRGTYGEFKGTQAISHVGIYTGNGMMVDRSTSSKPVRQRSIDTFGKGNYVFVRPYAYGNETPSQKQVHRVQQQTQKVFSTFGGSASFYGGGDGFDGKPTANGEIFNTNKLTAAHKNLPFGTMVRVTNANNGKSVVVRINDRGPFIKGRTIDLSKAAAQQIGMVESGHAPIKGEVLGKVPKGAEGDRMISAANAGQLSAQAQIAQIQPKLKPQSTIKAANIGLPVAPSQLQGTIAETIKIQQQNYVQQNELIQKQKQEELKRSQQEALIKQQRNLDQFRRSGRDLIDQRVSGRRQMTDLAVSASKNPTPKQSFAVESTRIQREFDDAITERERQIEDAQQRIKAASQGLASGEIKTDAEKTALQQQMWQDSVSVKQLTNELDRLRKIRIDAAREAENLFKREEVLRQQAAGFAQERAEIEAIQARIERVKQEQTNQPYSAEALKLPALEEALALKRADLDLSEKIAQVEEDRFKHQISPEQADQRIETLKRENIQIQQSVALTRQLAEEQNRIAIARRNLEYREQVTGLNTEFMRSQIQLRGLGKGDADVLELTRESALLEQNIGYERQQFDIQELGRTGQRSREEVENLLNSLRDLNQVKLDNIQAEFASSVEERDFNTKQRLFQSDQDLAGGQTEFLRSRGFEKQARDIEKQSAIAAQEFNFASSIRDLDQLVERGEIASQAAVAVRQNLELLNEVKLANIQAQFDPWMQTFTNAQQSFQSFFGSVLSGSSSIGDAFKQMVDSIAQNLANLAAQFITNELFKNVFGLGMPQQTQFGLGGGGLFGGGGGGGGGGLLGDIFGFANMALPIFGMAKGGLVRNYATGGIVEAIAKERAATGARPQLAVLSEGEMVLTIAQAKRFQDLNLHKVVNYADGGVVGRASAPVINNRVSEGGMTFNIPVTVSGGDRTSVNVPQLQSAIRAAVVQEIQNQQRPGGAIGR